MTFIQSAWRGIWISQLVKKTFSEKVKCQFWFPGDRESTGPGYILSWTALHFWKQHFLFLWAPGHAHHPSVYSFAQNRLLYACLLNEIYL